MKIKFDHLWESPYFFKRNIISIFDIAWEWNKNCKEIGLCIFNFIIRIIFK